MTSIEKWPIAFMASLLSGLPMWATAQPQALPEGSVQAPNYHECCPADVQNDVSLRTRVFTYKTGQGIVSGAIWNVIVTIDRPAKQVWPYLKNWNLWMSPFRWPGVVGDLYDREERDFEKGTFRLTVPTTPPREVNYYQLLSVIPEHLIVLYEPIVEGDDRGGISPGRHVYMLNERDGKTIVTITMEHAHRTQAQTQEEAADSWRARGKQVQQQWRDKFIPALKKLVYAGQ